jgi:hypothetical protein
MLLSKIRSTLRGLSFPSWSVPIALLILVILSYGLRVFTLGFYWDDWPYLWFFERLGPSGIIQAFSGDRPFLSFIYIICLSVFGHSALGWQIFGLLARWLCSLGLWWALRLTWPKHADRAAWVAFLFTVYPGFMQQWISVIYGQAFFLFAALFFSIAITLWLARRKPAPAWMVIGTLSALALSAFTMFSTEYFFGLELLRPALLWLVLPVCINENGVQEAVASLGSRRRDFLQRVKNLAIWWAPYLALMGVFVFWRSFIHVFAGYEMSTLEKLEQSPLVTLWKLAITIVKDSIVSSIAAWGQVFQLGGMFDTGASIGLRLLGLILFTGLLVSLFLSRVFPRGTQACALNPGKPDRWSSWSIQAILVGLFALLIAGWPFWITQLTVQLSFPRDRFTLPFAVGVSLVLAGLVDGLGKNIPRKVLIIGAMVALATGFHFTNSGTYREDWNKARDFFWQLTWRAPAVEANTVFLTTSMPFRYFEDDSLTAPLNWTYDPDGRSSQMNYILYDLYVRYANLPYLQGENAIKKEFRATQFNGSTTRVLVFYYAPPGCVRILDPVYDADLYSLPKLLLSNLSVSRPGDLIRQANAPAAPQQDIFGKEPKHRWCYFFEKADLARQNGDWNAIVELSSQSIRVGYRPEDPAEYLPFIEAYIRVGYWEDAFELTQSTYNEAPALRPALCSVWRRTANELTSQAKVSSAPVFANANGLLNCPTP